MMHRTHHRRRRITGDGRRSWRALLAPAAFCVAQVSLSFQSSAPRSALLYSNESISFMQMKA